MPNYAMRLLIGPPPNPTPAIPAVQTISLGAKTLKGLGGHALGVTNGVTPVITSQVDDLGATVSLFSIDAQRKLVFSGTYGTAAPALTRSSFVVTVTVGGDVGVVNVNTPANTWHVTSINSGANADSTGNTQLQRTLSNSTQAPGDTVICRDDMVFNPSYLDFRVFPGTNAAVTAAMSADVWTRNASDNTVTFNIPDANWITVRSETPYQAQIRRLTVVGSSRTKLGIRFTQLNFERPYQGVAFAADHILKFGTGPTSAACSHFDVVDNLFSSNRTDPDTQLSNSQVVSGINITLNCRNWAVRENTGEGLLYGIEAEGTRRATVGIAEVTRGLIYRNRLDKCIEDALKLTNCDGIFVAFNTIINKTYSSSGGHGDFIQVTWASSGAPPEPGNWEGGAFIGNILVRGRGTPGWKEGQGIFITTASTVQLQNTRIQGNLIVCTEAQAIALNNDNASEVSFNTIVRDETVGITQPSTPSTVVGIYRGGSNCGTSNVRYNTIYNSTEVALVGGAPSPTLTNNIANLKAAQYADAYDAPAYGADSDTRAEALVAWAMKAGGTLDTATTGYPYPVGAVGTGLVNFDNFTTSFPF